ncbi:hypothetical protein LV457_01490 [Mycobacterium sp. MYCO198283]|uniref:hypothetical protein n=1 Tax=Mycobacterium sp. MYCO198283 TaxID=2883505 RepID=UPI001E48C9C7|nr:hypothetical protein [Mycobacterium sp. MYCO198283]MCG5430971.1 hypothetical protein [Mycobacterium sp. MYCO198283]
MSTTTLKLPTNFVDDVRQLLDDALTEEQRSVAELHAAVSRKLRELEAKEDRLLDLLTDDRLPRRPGDDEKDLSRHLGSCIEKPPYGGLESSN